MAECKLVQADPLRRFCAAAFEQVGVPPEDAAIVADTLVEADLRGVHSHGSWWVTTYTRRLRMGGLNPRPDIRVVRASSAMVVLDADGGMGQVAGVAAMHQAIQKARVSGVGCAAVRNSNHFGAAAYYAILAARENQIGFATTEADPIMAPWGGAKAVVGNNPLAYAIPAANDFTIVLDMAQSVVAWGKIYLAAQRGERIPLGWALSKAGEPTEDAHEGMMGLLVPVGGYKGYGLALVMEVLSSVLAGATFGLSIPPIDDDAVSQGYGHFFVTWDVSHFMSSAEFQQRMAILLAEHRSIPTAKGVERTYLPGEIEHLNREQRLKAGIPLESHVIEALIRLGEELGLDTSALPGTGPDTGEELRF